MALACEEIVGEGQTTTTTTTTTTISLRRLQVPTNKKNSNEEQQQQQSSLAAAGAITAAVATTTTAVNKTTTSSTNNYCRGISHQQQQQQQKEEREEEIVINENTKMDIISEHIDGEGESNSNNGPTIRRSKSQGRNHGLDQEGHVMHHNHEEDHESNSKSMMMIPPSLNAEHEDQDDICVSSSSFDRKAGPSPPPTLPLPSSRAEGATTSNGSTIGAEEDITLQKESNHHPPTAAPQPPHPPHPPHHHHHHHLRFSQKRRARAAAAATKVLQSGYFYMTLLALQFGCQPMLARRFIPKDAPKLPVVMVTEAVKILLCIAFLTCEKRSERMKLWKTWTLGQSLRVAALPAALYALQNVLAQVGYQHLDSLTFNLLNQTKTIAAALCLYLFLGTHQTPLQLVALTLLLAASMILNWPSSNNKAGDDDLYGHHHQLFSETFYLGILPVLGASFLSGLSAALTQKTLQGLSRNSYLYSMELAIYGQVCLGLSLLAKSYGPILLSMVIGGGGGEDSSGSASSHTDHSTCSQGDGGAGLVASLLAGWTGWTLIPIFINAAGGIIVGLVTKYAGGVSKGFALIAGILLTAFIQAVVQARPPPFLHWIAAILVATSTYMHQAYRPKAPAISGTAHRKKSHPPNNGTAATTTTMAAAAAAQIKTTAASAASSSKDKDL